MYSFHLYCVLIFPYPKTGAYMNLANTLDQIIRSLGIRISKYEERCGVPNSAMTNALAGKPVRAVL